MSEVRLHTSAERSTEKRSLLADDGAPKSNKKLWMGLAAIVFFVALIVIVVVATRSDGGDEPGKVITRDDFADVVASSGVEDMVATLTEFEAIAKRNNNSRSVVNGYNESAAYITEQLELIGARLRVQTQSFEVPVAEQLSTPVLSLIYLDGTNTTFTPGVMGPTGALVTPGDFVGIRYGGFCENVCDVRGPPRLIAGGGCNATEFEAVAGAVVIIPIGMGCEYFDKALHAQRAGVSAVLFQAAPTAPGALPSSRARKTGWVMGDPIITIPCLGVTKSTGDVLLAQAGSEVSVRVHHKVTMHWTSNVFALDTRGEAITTVLIGAHLDSVPEGPGLNDNGSGSAMVLALAKQWAKLSSSPARRVMFAWWGAEEIGLLGSYHFVHTINKTLTNNETVVEALNFDMVASPNGNRGVHNGTLTPTGTHNHTVLRSNYITGLFADHFDRKSQAWVSESMTGGSDYLPFITAGIPAGGLASGATGVKTMADRETFGGLANAWKDPCYHNECDTLANIDRQMLTDLSAAAASVLWSLAHEA